MKQKNSREEFLAGVKAALPLAIGYLPIAATFGLVAQTTGLDPLSTCLMSLLVYAGASQFIALNLLALGIGAGEIIFTTFILNLRHFLMSASLTEKLEPLLPLQWRCILAFGITDETFSLLSFQKSLCLSRYFTLGCNLFAFLAWNFGTWAGLFFAAEFPAILQSSMGIALYAMFIGLLLPSVKKSRPALIVASLSIIINMLYTLLPLGSAFSPGWGIILATIGSAACGAALYKGEASP